MSISIHAPHARSDGIRLAQGSRRIFQSTLLMRGATARSAEDNRRTTHFNPRSSCEERLVTACRPATSTCNFNPRSSCEERLPVSAVTFGSALISIHAPHARSDLSATINSRRRLNFNPRSSCEERRALSAQFRPAAKISIHAPHARSDNHRGAGQALARRISIHAPHARSDPFLPVRCRRAFRFQSTLLMRGATRIPHDTVTTQRNFNPRSSCEERRKFYDDVLPVLQISIHAPHARSDLVLAVHLLVDLTISIHAPHARSDLVFPRLGEPRIDISIHAPHARSDSKS